MPIKYKEYPPNWKTEIRPAVMTRAGEVRDAAGIIIVEAKCEKCGAPNHCYGYRAMDGTFYPWVYIEEQLERHGNDLFADVLAHHIKKDGTAGNHGLTVVLTVAHLDHDKGNAEVSIDRLRAWCQRCHLDYDKDHHAASRKKTIEKRKGIIKLF